MLLYIHIEMIIIPHKYGTYIYSIYMYYFILNNIIGICPPSASVDAWHLFSAKSTTQDLIYPFQLTRSLELDFDVDVLARGKKPLSP